MVVGVIRCEHTYVVFTLRLYEPGSLSMSRGEFFSLSRCKGANRHSKWVRDIPQESGGRGGGLGGLKIRNLYV